MPFTPQSDLAVSMNTEVKFSHERAVSRICQTDVVCCSPEESLDSALKSMSHRRIGSVLVCNGNKPVGILTRRQAMSCCVRGTDPANVSLDEVMSGQLLLVKADDSIDEVGVEMMTRRLQHAVVTDDNGGLLGIVSESDIVNSQGIEHDLFLRSVVDIAPVRSLFLDDKLYMRDAIQRIRAEEKSAAVVRSGGRQYIITETDIISLLASGAALDRPLCEFALSELVTIDESISLFIARKIFRRHGFRHLGLTDTQGRVTRVLSYSDILRSVERDYVARLRELLANRNHALQQSQHNLRLIERVINASMEGVVVTDSNGAIQSVNPAFSAITGYEAHEVIGRNPNILSSGRHDRQFYQDMWAKLKRDGEWQGEIWNRTRSGTVFPEWLSITAISDDKGQVTQYAAIFHDLTETKRSEDKIRRMAQFDDLTRLANRKLFSDRLGMALHYAQENTKRIAVLAVDLDMFKRVNDRFGHDAGDDVIRTLAKRIEGTLGSGDTAARPAGDEFSLILSDVSEESLTCRVEHLARVISTPVLVGSSELRITASIGVAIYPTDGESVEELLRAADAAMHNSKDLGRNSWSYFSSEMHQRRQSRYLIGAHLQQALPNKEMHLAYQPKLSLKTGEVVGVEALLRWQNAELGTVPPDQFVPLAEDSGLIHEIGDWVLETAIGQARRWQLAGRRLPVAVNLSARQFQREGLVGRVKQLLEKYTLDAALLCVELTETCFLHSAEETAQALHELRECGVKVSIDDFGTGYSSLSYIRTMSLDQLKIDRSFVNNINEAERDRQLVSAMIAMSQALGLNVVAEGVETREQLDMLRQLGCDEVQGYLICRPKPAEELDKVLSELAGTHWIDAGEGQ